jgi:hypothetical protein
MVNCYVRNKLPKRWTKEIVSVIAVGYAAKEAKMPKRKTVDEIAKFY